MTDQGRLVELAKVCGIPIWHSVSEDHWWMEPPNAQTAREILRRHPDAIRVTNAYDVLSLDVLQQLMDEALTMT